MPALAYMQIYHGGKSRLRRLFLTAPGWCGTRLLDTLEDAPCPYFLKRFVVPLV
jgi:hypothetical protein